MPSESIGRTKIWLDLAEKFSAEYQNVSFEELFTYINESSKQSGILLSDIKDLLQPLSSTFELSHLVAKQVTSENPDGIRFEKSNRWLELEKLNVSAATTLISFSIAGKCALWIFYWTENNESSEISEASELIIRVAKLISTEFARTVEREIETTQERRKLFGAQKATIQKIRELSQKCTEEVRQTKTSLFEAVDAAHDELKQLLDEVLNLENERLEAIENDKRNAELEAIRSRFNAEVELRTQKRLGFEELRDAYMAETSASSYKLAYQIGNLPGLVFSEDRQIVVPEDLRALSPSGPDVIVIDGAPSTVETVKNFSTLVAAGRNITLVAVQGLNSEAEPWLAEIAKNHVLTPDASSVEVFPDWYQQILDAKMPEGLVLCVSQLIYSLNSQEFEIVGLEKLNELTPQGKPVIIYTAYPISVDQAREISSLALAGRKVAIVIDGEIDDEVRQWIPNDVRYLKIPDIRFNYFFESKNVPNFGIEPIRESNEKYKQWSASLFSDFDSTGNKKYFGFSNDDEVVPSQYAQGAQEFSFMNPNLRNFIIPSQHFGAHSEMNFLNPDLQEIHDYLLGKVESIREKAGSSLVNWVVDGEASTAECVFTTPYGVSGSVFITRNWDFESEALVTRYGITLGLVTNDLIFDLSNPNLEAAVWPVKMALARSWPISMTDRTLLTGPFVFEGGLSANDRFPVKRWMSVDPAPTLDSKNATQFCDSQRIPVCGPYLENDRPLSVRIGFEVSDDDLLSNVFFALSGAFVLNLLIDVCHLNKRIHDELGLIPYADSTNTDEDPYSSLAGKSSDLSDDDDEEDVDDDDDDSLESSSGKIGTSGASKIGGNDSAPRGIGDNPKQGKIGS